MTAEQACLLAMLDAQIEAGDGEKSPEVAALGQIARDPAALRKALGGSVKMSAVHAPAGGVTIGGKEFHGGEFIPGDVLDKATPEERAKVEGKEPAEAKAAKETDKPKAEPIVHDAYKALAAGAEYETGDVDSSPKAVAEMIKSGRAQYEITIKAGRKKLKVPVSVPVTYNTDYGFEADEHEPPTATVEDGKIVIRSGDWVAHIPGPELPPEPDDEESDEHEEWENAVEEIENLASEINDELQSASIDAGETIADSDAVAPVLLKHVLKSPPVDDYSVKLGSKTYSVPIHAVEIGGQHFFATPDHDELMDAPTAIAKAKELIADQISDDSDDDEKGAAGLLAKAKARPQQMSLARSVERLKRKAVQRFAATFDESKHPRAKDGEFGTKPGQHGGKKPAGGGQKQTKQPAAKKPRAPEPPPLSEKAARAKQSAKLVDSEIQRYSEEHNEPKFAKAIGGVSFPDGEAIDVAIAGASGSVAHGIELKTMVDNGNNKITMKRSAMERKAAWERKNRAPVHTVVLDDTAVFNANGPGQHDESKRRMFYRRGYGSFRVGTMHPVKNMAELKQLMGMKENQLPPAAQRPKGQKPGRLA